MVTVEASPTGIESVYSRMGKLLDIKLESESDAFRVVASGIPIRSYKRVAERLNFTADLVAPSSTVRRRLVNNSPFSVAESERIVRLTRVFAEAVELFGDEKVALSWFRAPADYLEGEPPISPMALAATDAGARLIESRIRRTAYGIF